jgi:hypothetical protein
MRSCGSEMGEPESADRRSESPFKYIYVALSILFNLTFASVSCRGMSRAETETESAKQPRRAHGCAVATCGRTRAFFFFNNSSVNVPRLAARRRTGMTWEGQRICRLMCYLTLRVVSPPRPLLVVSADSRRRISFPSCRQLHRRRLLYDNNVYFSSHVNGGPSLRAQGTCWHGAFARKE